MGGGGERWCAWRDEWGTVGRLASMGWKLREEEPVNQRSQAAIRVCGRNKSTIGRVGKSRKILRATGKTCVISVGRCLDGKLNNRASFENLVLACAHHHSLPGFVRRARTSNRKYRLCIDHKCMRS